MKIIKHSAEIIDPDGHTIHNVRKHIERCARTCYKSEGNITDSSSTVFVNALIKNGHTAMLEHGTIYLTVPIPNYELSPECLAILPQLIVNPYSQYTKTPNYFYITTNYRVIKEHGWEDIFEFIDSPTLSHPQRITVKIICDRGILAEFTRHRVFSFAAESTRYCNYSKTKFGNEITCIEQEGISNDDLQETLKVCEEAYNSLIDRGHKPENARAVLPMALKTEVIMTGFLTQWQSFFDLRLNGTTGKPHPNAKKIAETIHRQFRQRGLI